MRVTILTIGSQGDVQPYVALGAGLKAAGYEVAIATHPKWEGLVARRALGFAPVVEGELSRGAATEAGREWIERDHRFRPPVLGMLRDGASVAEQRVRDCWAATEGTDVVAVSILGLLLWLQIADARPLPLVRAFYAPPPPRLSRPALRQGLWLCARAWVNRSRRDALGLGPLGLREPLRALDDRRVPLLYGFSPAVYTPPESWADVTGYWMLDADSGWTPPAALSRFLSAGEPPVLITFGEMAERRPRELTALLLEAVRRAGRRAILVRGAHLAPDVALGPDGLAIDPAPYDRLFAHAAAVVHHGGAGTTAYALRAGVPSVVVPMIADQPFWARRVHELGVGPAPVPRRRLTAERLAGAIRRATEDVGMRRRAAALAQRLADEDGVAAAVAAFERSVSTARTPEVLRA